jgi:hypothetical protein
MPVGCKSVISPIVARRASAILLLGVIASAPVIAQVSDSDAHTVALATSSSAAPASSGESPLPANLIVPGIVRPLATSMWRQSATFRRQCARIAEHPSVIVRFELTRSVQDTGGARSAVERLHLGLTAAVEIELRKPELYVEHIAHELEHVLEQVDGIDLARSAHQGLDGVVNAGGAFETARARAVGRMVAREAMVR